MMRRRTPPRTDILLLLEAALVLLLFGLFIGLYFVPAGTGALTPRWWVWPIVVGLFFGILWLESLRRKRREASQMSSALQLESRPDDESL